MQSLPEYLHLSFHTGRANVTAMRTPIRTIALVIAIILCLFAVACSDGAGDSKHDGASLPLDPPETFTDDEAPVTLSHDGRNFESPWGYAREANAARNYPLLVSGYWGEGQGEYSAVSKTHPAFVIDYQKDGVGDGEALADWIDSAIAAGFRIDRTRVYLTGFSRGGSGSFPLAKGMYNKDRYFAAIVRVAGQSQSEIGNAIAEKTALWYHIGLLDTEQRVQVARALSKIPGYDLRTTETVENNSQPRYLRDDRKEYARPSTTNFVRSVWNCGTSSRPGTAAFAS